MAQQLQSGPACRRGAALVWITLLMVVVLAAAVFCVDLGRMMHVRSQLQRAVDAGALAAAMQLRDSSDPAVVEAKGVEFVQHNKAGWGGQVASADVTVTVGKWDVDTRQFTTVTQGLPDSVRVAAALPDEPFFFAGVFGRNSFAMSRQATATVRATPTDVMLVLDLSGSMGSQGRIQALRVAAPQFVETIRLSGEFHQVGVMGYGVRPEYFDPAQHGSGTPYTFAPQSLYPADSSWVGVLEGDLTFDLDAVVAGPLDSGNLVHRKYGGGTPIGAALRDGVHNVINSPDARGTDVAGKAVVLMSDGHANKPSDGAGYARQMAQYAADQEVVVYTISLGNSADDVLMQEIADISGGKHFLAQGAGAQLVNTLNRAFRNTAIAINMSTLVE